MRFPLKTLGLLLASLVLASCGGGGGDGGGATSPAANGTITLTATRTTLPLNPNNVLPYPGSPFLSEVQFTYRNAAGAITALTADATFTTSSPSTVSLSPPDDPSTANINEMATRVVTFPATTNNGSYVFFANSYDVAGTATITASATDPSTGRTVTKTLVITVQGTTPLPASVLLTPSPSNIYVQGAGGATSSMISAQVRDGANQPVPDPGSADNVRYEIVGDAGGAILSGPSGTGATVTARTVAGIAAVSFQSGTSLPPNNPVQIRATVDRSDNNVSNGISDPISATTSVVVSDGKLFGLVITSPNLDAIRQNLVYEGVDADGNPIGSPDGTYSFTISAEATDRQGAPVIPGTNIQFGVVDAPVSGFPGLGGGTFQIAGSDGNPVEGGTGFTAPTGQFQTAGGGAGPGDTVLVFGQLVQGNFDLENIRIVQSVNSQTSLTVTNPFNRNDTTGTSVNYGNVLPYVIGRATEANITASALTNDIGVASTRLNYPVSRLGKSAIVWAQGNAATSPTVRTVGDIQPMRLPGIAPAVLSISPTPIAGNTTTQVTACLVDAYNSPILGAYIGFSFSGLGVGTGRIDGVAGSGYLANPTGLDGCTTGTVVTTGISSSDADAQVVFTAGGEPVEVPIEVSTSLLLQAFPSAISDGSGTVTLLLTDGSGNPVPNAQIVGTCTGGPGINGIIAPTGSNGRTTAVVTSGTLAPVCPGTAPAQGTCTFSTGVQGGPTATVTVLGPVYGSINFSPDPGPPPSSCTSGP
ncbi:MAG: hypothetical protein J0L88_01730 [Xanthomonadales bacterium]|nr:hypothetical protein [Xanthomonadales bacterium]